MNTPKQKAFLYFRKSQDREDRQVLSIEGQMLEIQKFLKDSDFVGIPLPPETQSGYSPGRPIYNDMMERIEAGEVRHIICWNANRLSRNAKDSGTLLYALSTGKLLSVVTPTRRYSHAIPEDHFMLNIEFGTAKMYSDGISKGVKRGYATKYERGEYPSWAPVGMINIRNRHNRNIAPDPVKGPLIIKAFEAAATGTHSLETLLQYTLSIGLLSRNNTPITKSSLFDLLKNPVYAGTFFHGGTWHHGSYEPLISQELFDAAQVGMGFVRARTSYNRSQFPYKGILRCGGCGCSVTAEMKVKVLSDGRRGQYTYYRCTRKSKSVKCKEATVTEANLVSQFTAKMNEFSISAEAGAAMIEILRKYLEEEVSSRNTMIPVWRADLAEINTRLDRLTEMRINNEIDATRFKALSLEAHTRRSRIESLLTQSEQDAASWFELAKSLFGTCINLGEVFTAAEPEDQRTLLLTVGSNWLLTSKKTVCEAKKPYDLLQNIEGNDSWRAVADQVRTFFMLNATIEQ